MLSALNVRTADSSEHRVGYLDSLLWKPLTTPLALGNRAVVSSPTHYASHSTSPTQSLAYCLFLLVSPTTAMV